MLTWEFPPRIVGGIAPHVYGLSRALAKMGIEVFVVTCDFPGAKREEVVDGVRVFRVDSYRFPTPDFTTWVAMMNLNLQMRAAELIRENLGGISLIHAHDWLVAASSIGLKHMFRLPLIATVHSTEYGRRNGLHEDYQRMIHSHEVWLSYEAWSVICCSSYMASHVGRTLGVPPSKIQVIFNGVDAVKFQKPLDPTFRNRFAAPGEKLILFVGRLVYEKGVHLLIDAIPLVLKSVDAKFVIVGDGFMKDQLVSRAKALSVEDKVYFTGYLDEATVINLFKSADTVVVPSLYEPFGIVALEAMATEKPVVTTGVGGLGEVVEHDYSGVKVYPSRESLASGITMVLSDKGYAERIARNARSVIERRFNWSGIGEETQRLYEAVLHSYEAGSRKAIKPL